MRFRQQDNSAPIAYSAQQGRPIAAALQPRESQLPFLVDWLVESRMAWPLEWIFLTHEQALDRYQQFADQGQSRGWLEWLDRRFLSALEPFLSELEQALVLQPLAAVAAQQVQPMAAAEGAQQMQPMAAAVAAQQVQPVPAAVAAQQMQPVPAAEGAQQMQPMAAAVAAQQVQPVPAAEGAQQMQPVPAAEGAQQMQPMAAINWLLQTARGFIAVESLASLTVLAGALIITVVTCKKNISYSSPNKFTFDSSRLFLDSLESNLNEYQKTTLAYFNKIPDWLTPTGIDASVDVSNGNVISEMLKQDFRNDPSLFKFCDYLTIPISTKFTALLNAQNPSNAETNQEVAKFLNANRRAMCTFQEDELPSIIGKAKNKAEGITKTKFVKYCEDNTSKALCKKGYLMDLILHKLPDDVEQAPKPQERTR